MIEVSEKYEPLFFPPKGVDTFIVTGGRFSQKSFAVSMASVTWAMKYEHRVMFSRFTNVSAKDSIIPEIEEKIEMLNYGNFFNINNARIESLVNKSKIVFKGMKSGSSNQTANLKGLKDFSAWILDEAEELLDYDTAEKTMLSIRGNSKADKYPNIKVFIMNPTLKTHWVYEKYFLENGVQAGFNGVVGNVCYIHTSYLDCLNFVPDDILNHFKKMQQNNPKRYNNVVMGGWLDKLDGVIFENWEYGNFVKTNVYGVGVDFGFSVDPTAVVEISIDKKRMIIYWRLVCYKTRLSTNDIYNELKPFAKNIIIGDSAEPRLISELQQKHLNINGAVKGPGSITERITTMQDYKHVIDPNSAKIASEFNSYVWHSKKDKIPMDANNHAVDAGGYIITELLKGPKKVEIFTAKKGKRRRT